MPHRSRLVSLILSLFALAVAASALAQSGPQSTAAPAPTSFSAEKMWSLDRLAEPTLSPDGKLAVVPVTAYDVAANKGLTDLWILPTAGGPARQLTSDAAPDTAPVFSPDGKWIAFLSKRGDDKESQVYVIATDGGEARRVTAVPNGAEAPRWFPDSRHIAFITSIWTDLVRWEDQAKRMKDRADSKMTGRVWTRAPIAYWDHLLDDTERHLYSISIDGGEPVAITRLSGYQLQKQEVDEYSYDISPDGLEVAFQANTDKTGIDPNYDIITMPACGCKPPKDVTTDSKADDGEPRYSPDGKTLAFVQQRIKFFYADRTRLMLLDLATGRTKGITEDFDRSVSHVTWMHDNRSLVASIDDAGTLRLYRFNVSGGAPKAITPTPSFSALAVSAGAKPTAVAIRQSFTEPPTLVRLDLANGKATQLSTFNDSKLKGLAFGDVKSVTYKGAQNDDVQMWVVYPPDFDPSKKYPVYMLLHGGPHNGIVDGVQWRWNAHVFASWGYIVTWHNFHGSSGFGQTFTDSINPDPMSFPYEDTIKAADWLMAQPYVDRDRMAAGGGSFGGYLASVLLGHPHPFKTLIAHAAVYDEFTQIGSDFGAEKERFYNYWEKPDEFAKISPHTYAANFNTPTLVIHNQQDQRVPVNQGLELFNILQRKGIPSKLLYFPDENHWVLKPQNSLFWYSTVKDWLAQYVPPGAR
jgi:dipeptidyl aminopeptidase/acylaminoacyl peptidase